MIVYLVNIIVTALISVIAVWIADQSPKKKFGQKEVSYVAIFCLLLVWVYIYANRGIEIGSDTSGYYGFYNLLTHNNLSLSETLAQGGDILFETIRYGINRVSHGNWKIFITVMGVITYIPVLLVLRKENIENFLPSVLLYIFMFHYYQGFNAIRQAMAVSLTFMAYFLFFRKKKYFKYVIIMLIAFGFHSTVLFVIPFHLLSKLNLKSKLLWGIIIIFAISGSSMSSIWNSAISVLSAIGNDTLANRYSNSMYSGSGLMRVAVCLVPLLIGFWKRSCISKSNKEENDSFLIFLIFDTIFMMYSTYNWLFARLAMYFDIYAIVYIPKLKYIFSDRSKKIGVILILTLYFIYMILLILHGEANIYPYSFYKS